MPQVIKDTLTAGRKYHLAIICMIILLAGFVIGGLSPAFAALYPELTVAIIGTFFVYCGGNVANKFALGKKGATMLTSPAEEAKPDGTISD